MFQQQFINSLNQPEQIEQLSLNELELLIHEYPFFETAHLLYSKRLFQTNALNYSKQLRKTAIVANSRIVLHQLIHQESKPILAENKPVITASKEEISEISKEKTLTDKEEPKTEPTDVGSVTTTSDSIKVIYVNTVPSSQKITETNPVFEKTIEESKQDQESDVQMVQNIENATDETIITPGEKLQKEIELEISKGIIQSYVETDIIKTPELQKEEPKEPVSFTDWLNKVKKEAHSIQKEVIPIQKEASKEEEKEQKTSKNEQKNINLEQKRQIIDKIIESDPGRIKLGSAKFFTPSSDAKQSLLENEHLVTETLAKIYALQGNISKAIRAYEILSLKFPQKSVYFASLIEKLKTNK